MGKKRKFTRRGFLGTTAVAGLGGLSLPTHAIALNTHSLKPWAPEGGTVNAIPVGHQYRQDDMISIAMAPDRTVWVAWLSFEGNRDDVAIRAYKNNVWDNLQWVPGTSGDSWLPYVAVDAANRVWVVWSQQANGEWDIYARRFDPAAPNWGPLHKLTSNPLPDIYPCVWSDGKGRAAVVWQGFRRHSPPSTGASSNIFLRTLEGEKWSEEIRVTQGEANDWEPSVAIDSKGTVWVAYDSYKNGHYDVFLTAVRRGEVGEEIPVAITPRFDARATLAVDTLDRVWIAWESGHPNWGKPHGRILGDRQVGVPLGGFREPKIRCYENGKWLEPQAPLAGVFKGTNTYQPHVFSDGAGSVWVVAQPRTVVPRHRPAYPQKEAYWETWGDRCGYWEYVVTHLDQSRWSEPNPLPNSKGRSSTRVNAALAPSNDLWLAWPTDNRTAAYYHRPIRQQVYAGMILAPTHKGPMALRPSGEETSQSSPASAHERRDVEVMRQYRTSINGKEHRLLRGDFHRHTELSWDEGGRQDGSLPDFYRYMLDAVSMDFGANTDHQGGAWPYWWWYSLKMTDMFYLPDAYVSFFAYERSSSFPFGHHNVFYPRRADAHMVPYYLRRGVEFYNFPLSSEGDEPADECGLLVEDDIQLLDNEVGARHGITIPHTTGTGMGTDWEHHFNMDVEPVVEIFQGLRQSYEQVGAPYCISKQEAEQAVRSGIPPWPAVVGTQRPEGMVVEGWGKGYRLGVIASSDHVSTHLSFAMVYTNDMSREGILDAFRKRHTYGATDNILLEVRMGEHFMGDLVNSSGPLPPLRIKARGTGVVSKVDVLKDGKVIRSAEPNRQEVNLEFQVTIGDNGRHYYYVRLLQKDGMIAWSSPIFVNWK